MRSIPGIIEAGRVWIRAGSGTYGEIGDEKIHRVV